MKQENFRGKRLNNLLGIGETFPKLTTKEKIKAGIGFGLIFGLYVLLSTSDYNDRIKEDEFNSTYSTSIIQNKTSADSLADSLNYK